MAIAIAVIFISFGCLSSETDSTKKEYEKVTDMNIYVGVKGLKEEKGIKSYLVGYREIVNAFLSRENIEVLASINTYCINQTGGGMSQHPDYIYLESIKKGTTHFPH